MFLDPIFVQEQYLGSSTTKDECDLYNRCRLMLQHNTMAPYAILDEAEEGENMPHEGLGSH